VKRVRLVTAGLTVAIVLILVWSDRFEPVVLLSRFLYASVFVCACDAVLVFLLVFVCVCNTVLVFLRVFVVCMFAVCVCVTLLVFLLLCICVCVCVLALHVFAYKPSTASKSPQCS